MRSDVALCAHLGALSAGEPAFTFAPDEIIGWYAGPVEAIVRCRVCGAVGWIELLDWTPDQAVRVFALAGLRQGDASVYLDNRRTGSCDVKRSRAELEALVACAGPFERLFAWSVSAAHVLAATALPHGMQLPSGEWSERLPPPADATWFARLGLEKTRRG